MSRVPGKESGVLFFFPRLHRAVFGRWKTSRRQMNLVTGRHTQHPQPATGNCLGPLAFYSQLYRQDEKEKKGRPRVSSITRGRRVTTFGIVSNQDLFLLFFQAPFLSLSFSLSGGNEVSRSYTCSLVNVSGRESSHPLNTIPMQVLPLLRRTGTPRRRAPGPSSPAPPARSGDRRCSR